MDNRLINLSYNWLICNGKDITQIEEGISLSKLLQIYVYEKLNPKSNSITSTKNFKSIIKNAGLDWQLRFFHSKLISSLKFNNKKGNVDVILIYDVNNKPMIKNLNLIAEELLKENVSTIAIALDENIKKQINVNNLPIYYFSEFYSFNFKQEKTIREIGSKIKKNIETSESCIVSNLSSAGISLNKNKLLRFFKSQIYQTLREIETSKNILKELTPKALVTSSDAHKISRMLVLLANRVGIQTYVIQHGAPIWEYAYIPVFAKKIFVWGEESKRWFLEKGTEESKIVVTGCPRYDTLNFEVFNVNYKNMKDIVRNKPNVCFFTNPIDLEINERIIKELLSLDDNLYRKLIIKIHPSEDISFYKALLRKYKISNNVGINQSIGIPDELSIGDIGIVVNSTVGIEAISKGLILINLDFDEIPNSIPYEKYGICKKVKIDFLKKEIEINLKNRQNITYISKYINNCNRFLKNYLSNVEEPATFRIVNYIKKHL